ncbi:acetate kinase [Protomyces lactucae-debilis]|uniref:Probable acetate kinase n=1 Tax=Protomyces lactucae-debilis TaxID=2754530 RepID=A0A1Y2FSE6_PROLT|nr:acetate kinase [Protomyces lactucae-debilis]ORY85635.1 acetate kinase [Protomyces lactucae-debilis]
MSQEKLILAVNAGSSSVKISVYVTHAQELKQVAEATLSGLTSPPAKLKLSIDGKSIAKDEEIEKIESQEDAFGAILTRLESEESLSQLKNKNDITHVVHRVVHGGDFQEPQKLTPETVEILDHLTELAPLHNAPALAIVKKCNELLSHAHSYACFDTQFHATIPKYVSTYPIDPEIAEKNKLRRYGFHGLSYSFMTRTIATALKRNDVNLILCHLGSGASVCAVEQGKSIDTTMGLTPLEGLPGATRSGSLDPSLIFHYASNVGKLSGTSTSALHISKAEEILNKQAGWKALTGTTDFGVLTEKMTGSGKEAEACHLAFDLFVHRLTSIIGGYFVQLEGKVDALVFAGGIGEKSDVLRRAVVDKIACLGFSLHAHSQDKIDRVQWLGDKVLLCETDEQREMAQMIMND